MTAFEFIGEPARKEGSASEIFHLNPLSVTTCILAFIVVRDEVPAKQGIDGNVTDVMNKRISAFNPS